MDIRNLSKYMLFISLSEPMNGVTYRVLLYLIGTIGFSEEYQRIKQINTAINLNISKSDMSKSITKLIQLGVIETETISERITKIRLKELSSKELKDRLDNL